MSKIERFFKSLKTYKTMDITFRSVADRLIFEMNI